MRASFRVSSRPSSDEPRKGMERGLFLEISPGGKVGLKGTGEHEERKMDAGFVGGVWGNGMGRGQFVHGSGHERRA